jgi:arylsulfatase A-like enzyme
MSPPALSFATVLAVALTSVCHPATQDSEEAPARPDIVLVIADDLAESDLDLIPTPHIDGLAARGVRFRRAYANPLCMPSRHSLLFGVWADRGHGDACSPGTEESLDTGIFGLGKLMQAAGYVTGFFGKWHLGSNNVGPWETTIGLHGFDAYRAVIPQGVESCGGKNYRNWLRVDDGVASTSRVYATDAIRDAFLGWWAEDHGGAPRFGIVSMQAPHAPQHFPPASSLPEGYPRPEKPRGRGQFEALVVTVDEVLGRVVEVAGDDALVLFLGDNGTPRYGIRPDQSRKRVKFTTREDGVHVPFVLAGPGVTRGAETQALIHLADVLPTLADALGRPVPDTLDGRSFAHVLRDPTAEPLRPYVYCARKRHQAVILGHHKLNRFLPAEGEPRFWLFDLEADPGEENELDLEDPAHAEIVARMQEIFANP